VIFFPYSIYFLLAAFDFFSAHVLVPPSLIHEGKWRKFRGSIGTLNLNIFKIILSFAPPPLSSLEHWPSFVSS
jgi:hypothetical protein